MTNLPDLDSPEALRYAADVIENYSPSERWAYCSNLTHRAAELEARRGVAAKDARVEKLAERLCDETRPAASRAPIPHGALSLPWDRTAVRDAWRAIARWLIEHPEAVTGNE